MVRLRNSGRGTWDIFSEIFSWWGGNTWGTRLTIWRQGRLVGKDDFGNRYYEQKKGVGPLGVPRRWVTYSDFAEASKVPASWHGWLHYTVDTPPTAAELPAAAVAAPALDESDGHARRLPAARVDPRARASAPRRRATIRRGVRTREAGRQRRGTASQLRPNSRPREDARTWPYD